MLLRHGPQNNSSFHLLNFDFIHQERKAGKKAGGIVIYLKNDIKFMTINNLSVSDGDNKHVTAEIENENYMLQIC